MLVSGRCKVKTFSSYCFTKKALHNVAYLAMFLSTMSNSTLICFIVTPLIMTIAYWGWLACSYLLHSDEVPMSLSSVVQMEHYFQPWQNLESFVSLETVSIFLTALPLPQLPLLLSGTAASWNHSEVDLCSLRLRKVYDGCFSFDGKCLGDLNKSEIRVDYTPK